MPHLWLSSDAENKGSAEAVKAPSAYAWCCAEVSGPDHRTPRDYFELPTDHHQQQPVHQRPQQSQQQCNAVDSLSSRHVVDLPSHKDELRAVSNPAADCAAQSRDIVSILSERIDGASSRSYEQLPALQGEQHEAEPAILAEQCGSASFTEQVLTAALQRLQQPDNKWSYESPAEVAASQDEFSDNSKAAATKQLPYLPSVSLCLDCHSSTPASLDIARAIAGAT